MPDLYSDEAISGATDDRSGLKSLLEAATATAHPLDVILVDDTSRLSRKLADSLRIFDQLRFSGVRLIFVSQGIDTDSEQAEVLLATHGIVDSLYIRELAKKTHRGVEGRALQGFHTGGRCFGYRSVPIEDPTRTDSYGRLQIVGVKLEVHPEQAAIVQRIFADYAAGDSIKWAYCRPLFTILHGTVSILGISEVWSLWFKHRSDLWSGWCWMGEVRMPAPSESRHL